MGNELDLLNQIKYKVQILDKLENEKFTRVEIDTMKKSLLRLEVRLNEIIAILKRNKFI